jgi:hypothetical protein
MEKQLIDECFYLKQKYGVWVSHNKEDVPLITSGSEENCIFATRSYLKGLQEQNSLGIAT